jgi:hypothetical protein
MPEQDALTIEMEPVRGGHEFGPAQPEPQQVTGLTDEQMQQAAQFEQRYGATARVTAKQVLAGDFIHAELVDSTSQFLQRAADRADDERGEDTTKNLARGADAYTFSAKATDGRQVEQTLTAAGVEAATLEAWKIIQENQQSGMQIQSARIEWQNEEGPQVSHIYDRTQGFELSRPEGISFPHEQQMAWLEQEARLIRESSEVAGRIATEDIPLAEAYYSGRRDSFNSAREDFIQHNPDLANSVPSAIEADELRIQQRAIEPENLSLEFSS